MSNFGRDLVAFYKRIGLSARALNDDDAPGITTAVAHEDTELATKLYGENPNKPKAPTHDQPSAKTTKRKRAKGEHPTRKRRKGERPTRKLRKGSPEAKDQMAKLRKLIGKPKGKETIETEDHES